MEIDLLSAGAAWVPEPGSLHAPVCVVGGGIAGLVLADRLAASGVEVILLESGGRGASPPGEQGTAVELTGEEHVGSRVGRPRGLGGSSSVWGGQLLPMLPGDAWPVGEAELKPFYAEIERLMGVDDSSFQAREFFEERSEGPMALLAQLPRLTARMSKFAPFAARNLGRSLGGRLAAHPKVRVVLHAHVTGLAMGADGRVCAVEVRSPSGAELLVQAKQVVLAAGTVETCRLLLNLRGDAGEGAQERFAAHAQVGLGFHDHLTVEVARFGGESRDRAVALFRPWVVGGLRGTLHGLKLEADYRLRRKLGINFALAHMTFEEPEGSGVAAIRSMLQARQRGEAAQGVNWRGLPGALRDTWRLRRDVVRNGRRYLSPEVRVGLRVNVAQRVPGPSFVDLGGSRDVYGQRLPRVHWEHGAEDLRTVRLFADHLRRRFNGLGFHGMQWHAEALPLPRRGSLPLPEALAGRELDRPMRGLEDARHAMGGACMGSDPRQSVVDSNLCVHGIENLHVASAAVFPDGRAQLPTMTLMALTVRLADRLRTVCGQPGT